MRPVYQPRGKWFEELVAGDAWMSVGRTVTETDIVNFAGVSGDFNPLHTDEVASAAGQFGGRVAHGMCGLSIATGLFERSGIVEGTIIGFVGIEMKFRAPVRIGDTIRLAYSVARARGGQGGEGGVVIFHGEVVNQDDEIVMDGHITTLVKSRPAG